MSQRRAVQLRNRATSPKDDHAIAQVRKVITVLLTVRGRRSGTPRTVPIGMLELDGAWFIQASYGETGWVAKSPGGARW
jgi:hypothetical protein